MATDDYDIEALARDTPVVVPLFPLPAVVLLPGQQMPLHIFEPRYRAMLVYALAHGRRIAMAAFAPDWEDDYHGAPRILARVGIGAIVEHEIAPDGRANIVLLGVARADVREEIEGSDPVPPFRRARVRLVSAGLGTDAEPTGVPESAAAARAEFRAAFLEAIAACAAYLTTPFPEGALDVPAEWSVGTIADTLAAVGHFAFAVKQRLLEIDKDEARAAYFLQALRAIAPADRIDRRYGFPGHSAN